MTFEERTKQYNLKEYTIGPLTLEEEEIINKNYSISVEDVRPISKSQEWILDNKGVISSNFSIQTLLKVRGLVDINKIRANMIGIVKNNELLRSSFILNTEGRNLQVVLQDRNPEMTFIDFSKDKLPEFEIYEIIENVLAADRRRLFNLEKDRLIRIRVARFGNNDYAISIQQPQIISDGWDIRRLFDGVFSEQESDDVLAKMISPKRYSFEQYLERRKEVDIIKILDYWQKKLNNFKETNFPGYNKTNLYESNSLFAEFDDKMTSYMKKYMENITTQIVLLETAWGIMLQKYNQENDAVFPILLSNYRDSKEDNIDFATIINLVPIRMNETESTIINDAIKRQQANLILGRAYSGCTNRELEALFPDKKLFNHILNFHSFYKQQKYTKADVGLGVNVIKINSYDSYSNDLVVVFRQTNRIKIEFIYNKYAFNEHHIKKIKEDFFYVIKQVLTDPSKNIADIKLTDIEVDVDKQENDLKLSITQLLRTKSIFNSLNDRELNILIRGIIVKNFIYGDVILTEGEKQDFIYLIYDGRVELRRNTISGWTIKIATLGKGEFISYDGIFDSRESSIRATTISKDATIIAIRNDAAVEGIKNNFDFAKDIVKSITEQVNKFQKLWIENKS